ncbi:MAG: hypothetical protein MZW92_69655 [Comamonadaceae bacterium]|nr:hypothetical protein [Comamonadaceae bacterium]
MPDYLTSVRDGAFYGWPYSYYGQHVDDARAAAATRRWWPSAMRAGLRAGRAHRRSLGSGVLPAGTCCPAALDRSGMFIGQHGSWNRQPPQRLQGRLRAVRRRPAERLAASTC